MKVAFYHSPCNDGHFSAAVIKTAIPDIVLISAEHGKSIAADIASSLSDSEVYILDYSFSREVMTRICERNYKVVLIDHHNNPQVRDLETLTAAFPHFEFVFDPNHSGCHLTSKYFYPSTATSPAIDLVEARDLWVPAKDRDAFYLAVKNRPIEDLKSLALRFHFNYELFKTLISEGDILYKHRKSDILRISSKPSLWFKDVTNGTPGEVYPIPYPAKIAGFNVPADMVSDVCNRYLQDNFKEQKVCFGFQVVGTRVSVGLRSAEPFDCSVIARIFGGNGHPQAAGFSISLKNFSERVCE